MGVMITVGFSPNLNGASGFAAGFFRQLAINKQNTICLCIRGLLFYHHNGIQHQNKHPPIGDIDKNLSKNIPPPGLWSVVAFAKMTTEKQLEDK